MGEESCLLRSSKTNDFAMLGSLGKARPIAHGSGSSLPRVSVRVSFALCRADRIRRIASRTRYIMAKDTAHTVALRRPPSAWRTICVLQMLLRVYAVPCVRPPLPFRVRQTAPGREVDNLALPIGRGSLFILRTRCFDMFYEQRAFIEGDAIVNNAYVKGVCEQ